MTGDGHDLGQSLVLAPGVGFSTIAATLDGVGLTRAAGAGGPSLIAGEPEFCSWSRQGRSPVLTYTFNPVAMLRVLDVATAPPALRAALAARLDLLSAEAVGDLLDAADTRAVLRGLWAARETQRIDLLEAVQRLASGGGLIAEQAAAVARDLAGMAQAREAALVNLGVIARAAEDTIARLHDPAFTPGLRPDGAACAALFDAEVADQMAEAAGRLYDESPPVTGSPSAAPDITAAPAGLLRWPNPLSEKFPRGYRDIAGWMAPERVWLTWAAPTAGGGTVRYDGLAWLGDRWVWLPKPFRLIPKLAMSWP